MRYLVRTVEELQSLPIKATGWLAVDTETASNERLLTVQVAWSPDDAAMIIISDALREPVKDLLMQYKLAMHYGTYDCRILLQIGARLCPEHDTYAVARLLYYDKYEGFGLKVLAKQFCDMDMRNIHDVAGPDVKMEDLNPEDYFEYGTDDAIATYRLMQYQQSLDWVKAHKLLCLIESNLQGVVARMKDRGVLFNQSAMDEIQSELNSGISEIAARYPGVSLSAPADLERWLRSVVKLDFSEVNTLKSGRYSVNAEALGILYYQNPTVIGDIQQYRELTKLCSTYTVSYSSFARVDGAIHATFDPFGTATGRFSSSSPNMQNVPVSGRGKVIRKAFVARPGYRFVSMDYKMIEFIVALVLAEETKVLEFIDKGGDVHKLTASMVYGVDYDAVTKEQRGHGKTVNFAVVYGAGAWTFLPFCNGDWAAAEAMKKRFVDAYPKLFAYLERLSKAMFRGWTETWFGRRRKIGQWRKGMAGKDIAGLARLCRNSVIQGTAADIVKMAMCLVDFECNPDRVHIIMQIHDDIVMEIEDGEHFDEDVRCAASAMVKSFRHMQVDIKEGLTWYDLKPYQAKPQGVSESTSI